MKFETKTIDSNQDGIHERLADIVQRHLEHPFQKPIAAHTQQAFDEAVQWLNQRTGDLIFDSGCGIGESSRIIAAQNPQSSVIAIDRSEIRLSKHERIFEETLDNLLFVRADILDFWRLAVAESWQLEKHFILYPNPYPKAAHVQRRWHASPVFTDLLKLGGELTVRSNWKTYIDEFVFALGIVDIQAETVEYTAQQPMTAFERKYWASGQTSWQTCIKKPPEGGCY